MALMPPLPPPYFCYAIFAYATLAACFSIASHFLSAIFAAIRCRAMLLFSAFSPFSAAFFDIAIAAASDDMMPILPLFFAAAA